MKPEKISYSTHLAEITKTKAGFLSVCECGRKGQTVGNQEAAELDAVDHARVKLAFEFAHKQ